MAKEWARSFYNSKLWKSVRLEVLRRDHYTCAECFSRAEEVHHIIELTPENITDARISLNPDNLRCLCHDCHTKITNGDTGDVELGYVFDDTGQVIRR